jgi:cytochrome c oxidase cbb3-type subunit I
MNQSQPAKWMTHGEAGLSLLFLAAAFLSLIAAANALDSAFASTLR